MVSVSWRLCQLSLVKFLTLFFKASYPFRDSWFWFSMKLVQCESLITKKWWAYGSRAIHVCCWVTTLMRTGRHSIVCITFFFLLASQLERLISLLHSSGCFCYLSIFIFLRGRGYEENRKVKAPSIDGFMNHSQSLRLRPLTLTRPHLECSGWGQGSPWTGSCGPPSGPHVGPSGQVGGWGSPGVPQAGQACLRAPPTVSWPSICR